MQLVANARMYAATQDAAAAWRELLDWVAARSGIPLGYVAHAPPAPMAELWRRSDLGAVFMCGRPWTRAEPRPAPLAAPIPSPPRYGGLPRYMTDIVVRADSPFRTLADTFGHRIGYTIEESQSGFNALRHHLLGYRTRDRPRLYAESIGPLLTPRGIVEALLAGRIDAGPLDSWSHDLMQHDPQDPVHGLRTVASTAPTPIPFFVAAPQAPTAAVSQLREAFLAVAGEPALTPVRDRLLLAGFAPVEAAPYDQLIAQDREALAAGYDHPD